MNKNKGAVQTLISVLVLVVFLAILATYIRGLEPVAERLEDRGSDEATSTVELVDNTISFFTIEKGYRSGYPDVGALSIRSQDVWDVVWSQLYINSSYKPRTPRVDFEENMVVAVFQGTQFTKEHSITVDKIEDLGSSVNVHVVYRIPAAGCDIETSLNEPYHIVEMAKTDKTVTFSAEHNVVPCAEL